MEPTADDIRYCRGHQLPLTCVTVTSDSKFVFSGAKDCSIIKCEKKEARRQHAHPHMHMHTHTYTNTRTHQHTHAHAHTHKCLHMRNHCHVYMSQCSLFFLRTRTLALNNSLHSFFSVLSSLSPLCHFLLPCFQGT